MSSASSHTNESNVVQYATDTFTDKVNRILESFRSKILEQKPDDILYFIAEEAAVKTRDVPAFESCEEIIFNVPEKLKERPLTFIVFGASGDLAKKKTFPALFHLYCAGLLPPKVNIVGYARTQIPDVETWKRDVLAKFFTRLHTRGCHVRNFLAHVHYVSGSYDKLEDFKRLDQYVCDLEKSFPGEEKAGNRLFYLALPPTVFVSACTGIRNGMMPQAGGWVRVVVEKPFGRDSESSAKLSKNLETLFNESQLYRIDHYLGKEMVQNLLTIRFANRIFSSTWNSNNIASVQITFKETIGTEGRGGYFDTFGIIRDVMQNHLTQILALVAMEKPRSLDAEVIRDEKVALLRCIMPVKKENCVIGQYTASEDGSMRGYLEDEKVPAGSKCPTFAAVVLFIHNDRWAGVPFFLKAGKALETNYVGIRIQFKDEILPFGDVAQRNELIIRAQPSEAMYLKINNKNPGLIGSIISMHQTELDLTYDLRYKMQLPDAYESLLNYAILGNPTNFVRKDELEAAWNIFTPLLKEIDNGELEPILYKAGTRGPQEAVELVQRIGFQYQKVYQWVSRNKL